MKPIVSVIVVTRNSDDTIGMCLDSIKNQSYKDVEIIVVDNNSRDRTYDIAKTYGRVVFGGPERASQRNIGVKFAKGEFFLFVDSDMDLDREVVKECVERINGFDGMIIPEKPVGEGFWANCKVLERECYIGDEDMEAARFYRREAFLRVGRYDEFITGQEDLDLHNRVGAGGKIGRISSFITHHEGRLGFFDIVRKKYYYCLTLGRYLKKSGLTGNRQFRFFRPAFLRHWRKFLGHPLYSIGFLIMRLGESVAAVAGLVIGKYW